MRLGEEDVHLSPQVESILLPVAMTEGEKWKPFCFQWRQN
jgi:hypothetical protein